MGVSVQLCIVAQLCIGQRLVRLLCNFCKRHYEPTAEELFRSGLRPEEFRAENSSATSVAMLAPQPDTAGRTSIHEFAGYADAIREMIIERRPGSEIRRQG